MKIFTAISALICAMSMMSSYAQESVCFGFNCDGDPDGIPDIISTYSDVAAINSQMQFDFWTNLGGFEDETVEQCRASCDQDFAEDMQACNSGSNIEDAVIAQQALLNCVNVANRIHEACISPSSFLRCLE